MQDQYTPTAKDIQRFWRNVNRLDDETACWEWAKGKNRQGYGKFGMNNKNILAHRFIWIALHGPIPSHMRVCHHCDNPSCVNPAHLFLGTQSDNMNDMFSKGRATRKGEHNGRAKLTPFKVREIRTLYSEGGITQKQLAERFNIGKTQIGVIVRREQWLDID